MTIGPEPVDRAHDLSIDVSARAPLGLLDRFIPPGVSISPSAFDTHRQAPISLILLWMIVGLAKSMRRPVLLNIRNNRDCPSIPLRCVVARKTSVVPCSQPIVTPPLSDMQCIDFQCLFGMVIAPEGAARSNGARRQARRKAGDQPLGSDRLTVHSEHFSGERLTIETAAESHPASGGLDVHRRQLPAIADVPVDWGRTKADIEVSASQPSPDAVLRFVTPRVDPLHRVLLATGFDPRDVDRLVGMLADDGTRRAELSAIADEPNGAFGEVRRKTRRRWDEFSAAQEASRATVEARLAQSEAPVASVTPG